MSWVLFFVTIFYWGVRAAFALTPIFIAGLVVFWMKPALPGAFCAGIFSSACTVFLWEWLQ